jgi:hypothetical protein
MSKNAREHARAAEFTDKLKGVIQTKEFWEGYYKNHSRGFYAVVVNHMAPRMAAQIEIVFNSRAKQKWICQLANGTKLESLSSEQEVEFSLEDGREQAFGAVLGPRLLWAAEKQEIGDYLISGVHARILGSYGAVTRAWIATGYDEYRRSSQDAYYTCVSRDNHGLHDLNQMSLHFCYGILDVSYHWNNELWMSGNDFCTHGQCPQLIIESAPGKRIDQFFDVPFVGDAIAVRAYNYSNSWQMSFRDEIKTLNEWIAEGVV